MALVADLVPPNLRGTAFGFIKLAIGVALLPASLLAGGLWQGFGAEATLIAGTHIGHPRLAQDARRLEESNALGLEGIGQW